MKNEYFISARKEKDLTQKQLAEIIGCEKTTISNWENGYSSPTIEVAQKVSHVLDRDINHLFLMQKSKKIILG